MACPKCGRMYVSEKKEIWPDGTITIVYEHVTPIKLPNGKTKDREEHCSVNTAEKAPIPLLPHGQLKALKPLF